MSSHADQSANADAGESATPVQGHLVFVGLPGAGKSTIGRAVAKALGRPFLDFDQEIEKRSGMSVSRLFAEKGEPAFRALEIELTRELALGSHMVLAPGGGWVTNAGVVEMVRPPGRLVHLRISPDAALRRLTRSRVVRPLLKGADPRSTIHQLWVNRAHLYAQSDVDINVEVLDSQQVVDKIVLLARGLTTGLG